MTTFSLSKSTALKPRLIHSSRNSSKVGIFSPSTVAAAYPRLRCQDDERDQFRRALRFFAFVFRPDKVNTQYAASFWIDTAREWLRRQGYSDTTMQLKALVGAAVASGILFEPLDQFPFAINLGLSLGSASKPSNAWRDTLRNGIPEPVEPRRPRPCGVEQNINVVPKW
ncbi:MAG: hypothetical protein ACLPTZ_02560 [Beijerinckiaceae bacterium]